MPRWILPFNCPPHNDDLSFVHYIFQLIHTCIYMPIDARYRNSSPPTPKLARSRHVASFQASKRLSVPNDYVDEPFEDPLSLPTPSLRKHMYKPCIVPTKTRKQVNSTQCLLLLQLSPEASHIIFELLIVSLSMSFAFSPWSLCS